MENISKNIKEILSTIPGSVKLVAVSKTKPPEMILEAYHAGQLFFGENKVQDLARKAAELPTDIQWHFIGHLQTNKVKFIAPFVSMVHSIDSFKLLKVVDKEALKAGRVIKCLLQISIAQEETKFGLYIDEAEEILTSAEFRLLNNVQICGVMGMATYTDDLDQIRNEFRQLKGIYTKLKTRYFINDDSFTEISMGMSGDYQIAIEEGSTMIRVGSSIFGYRN